MQRYAAFSLARLSNFLTSIGKQHGATLYTIQLGLNLIWMPIFFGLSRPIEAAVDMLALIGTTSYLAYVWHNVDPVSTWTLMPYLCWLGFASYLSVSVHTDEII